MTELKVMSFNIRNSMGDLGTKHRWRRRKDKIIAIINKYGPDIIGFQEVLYKQLKFLKERLAPEGYMSLGVGRDDGVNKGEFNPIFFKNEIRRNNNYIQLVPSTYGTFWLSDTPDIPSNTWNPGHSKRICTWTKFSIISDGKKQLLGFFNTHLDVGNKESQIKSIELIAQKIKELTPEIDVILTGDMNFPRKSYEYEIFTTYFRDLIRECFENEGRDLKNIITFHAFTGAKTYKGILKTGYKGGEGGETFNNFDIDYIATQNGNLLKVKGCKIVYDNPENNLNTFPSDHWPIYCVVEINRN